MYRARAVRLSARRWPIGWRGSASFTISKPPCRPSRLRRSSLPERRHRRNVAAFCRLLVRSRLGSVGGKDLMRRRLSVGVMLGLALAPLMSLQLAGAGAPPAPPVAERRPVTAEHHGIAHVDEYAWLQTQKLEEVLQR